MVEYNPKPMGPKSPKLLRQPEQSFKTNKNYSPGVNQEIAQDNSSDSEIEEVSSSGSEEFEESLISQHGIDKSADDLDEMAKSQRRNYLKQIQIKIEKDETARN